MSHRSSVPFIVFTLLLGISSEAFAAPAVDKEALKPEFAPDLQKLLNCSASKFWFDGACRDMAWVVSVFGKKADAGHLGKLGGLGDRIQRDGNKMVLVEQFGQVKSQFGMVTVYTVLKPERPAAKARLAKPTRGGYVVERVVRRSFGFPGPQMSLRFEEVLVPKKGKILPELGKGINSSSTPGLTAIERKSVLTNYRNGRIQICDLQGCTEAIASMSSQDPAEFCGGFVEDIKHAGTFACDVGVVIGAANVGCLGGGIAGVLTGAGSGASVSLGTLTIPGAVAGGIAGCVGTGLLGGIAAGLAADPACNRLAEVLVPDWLVKEACIAQMKSSKPQPNILPDVGNGPSPQTDPGSAKPCEADVVQPNVGFESSDGGYCVADVIYSCGGVRTGSGECQLSGSSACGLAGFEAVTCGYGSEAEIEGHHDAPKGTKLPK